MIYIVLSGLYFLLNKNKNSIFSVLMGLLLFSSVAAYFVGRQHDFEWDTLLLTLYTAILLVILFSGFRSYSGLKTISLSGINKRRLNIVESVTSVFGVVVLVVYVYILSRIFSQLLLGAITVQEHKNEGGAAAVWDAMVPHIFITLGNFIAPLGYFFLSLHFFYLVQGKIKRAIKYFVLSLCLVLNGLIALSRSVSVQFILLYATILFCMLPLLGKKLKRRVFMISLILLGAIVLGLGVISGSRFSTYYTREFTEKKAILDETKQPVLFSLLDYFAQWEEDGLIIMKRHKPEYNSWGLYNCSGLAVQIQQKIYGAEKVNKARDVKYHAILKEQNSCFHGIVARLVYDFGFLGTVLFIIIYSVIIHKLGPRRRVLSFKSLMSLTIVLPACVVFWAGNEFSSLNLDLAIIYSFIIYLYVATYKRRKKKVNNNVTEYVQAGNSLAETKSET